MYTLVLLALAAQPKKDEAPKLDPFVAKAIEPAAADGPLRKLQKERVRERALAIAETLQLADVGRTDGNTPGELTRLRVTLAQNLAELMDKPADRVKCYEMRVDALKEYEKLTKSRVEAGAVPSRFLRLATADRLDAEIDLLKFKEAQKDGK